MRTTSRGLTAAATGLLIVVVSGVAPAGGASAERRPGPAKLYQADVDVTMLRPSDFAGFTPADFQQLPSKVRDAALMPVSDMSVEYASTDALDANRNPLAMGELCLTQSRTNYRRSLVGLKLLAVENKIYGCSDGIYFTETPIDLSSGRGS